MSMLSKLCNDLRNAADEGYCPNRDRLLMRDAAETIECLSAKVRANNLHDGWIPCSERLPEENGIFLTTNNMWGKDELQIDCYCDSRWQHGGTSVIAWMSLPEPYKPESEG